MPNISLTMDFAGQSGVPRLGRMVTDATKAEVATAGFLTNYLENENIALLSTDFIAVVASDGNAWYYPVFGANNVVTLTAA